MAQNNQNAASMPNYIKFAFGGVSGMAATCFVQPLDLIKNRMQLSQTKEHKTSFHLAKSIIKSEGISGIYSGLSAGLLRQATYTTTRLGVYTWLFGVYSKLNFKNVDVLQEPPMINLFYISLFLPLSLKQIIPEKAKQNFQESGSNPGFFAKAGIGMFAGVCGAFVGNPAELALVRMTADGRLPPAERRNYRNVFHAVFKIISEEGVLTLWRGAIPTMGRAMVVNGAQLASYSQAKEILLATGYFKENITLHFSGSMIAGLITTAASMPVDIVKTRIQNMKIVDGKPEFKGALDVLSKVMKNEGFFALWKGFFPYYARLGPHTVLTFIFLEQLNSFYLEMNKTQ